jgi:ubiquinone/menaquinone biosynthesis C-methylase UbiE
MELTMRERAFRPALIRAILADGPESVLDVGCGTGTLVRALALARPSVSATGIDGDAQVLATAVAKAAAVAPRAGFALGMADALPLEDSSVDVVVFSLVLHHLAYDGKLRALREARRVLRPSGRLIVADWGRPHDPLMRAAFFALQLLDGFESTRQHAAGELPSILGAEARFRDVRVLERWRTMWGSLELLSAVPAP